MKGSIHNTRKKKTLNSLRIAQRQTREVLATAQNQHPLSCPEWLGGSGTLTLNCCALTTPSEVFLGIAMMITRAQRDPLTLNSQQLPFLHSGIALSGCSIPTDGRHSSLVSHAVVLWMGLITVPGHPWVGWFVCLFLQKRAGSLFLVLLLPFDQRVWGRDTKKCGLKAKYHHLLKVTLQVSSPGRGISRTELYLAPHLTRTEFITLARARTAFWNDLWAQPHEETKSLSFTS